MHLPSIFAVTGIFNALFSVTIAYPENLRRLIPRAACYDDAVLLALKQLTDDTYPFCRQFIGIADITTTLPVVTKVTTVSTLVTTLFDSPITVTIPTETSFVTVTSTVDSVVERRQNIHPRADPSVTELVSSILTNANRDAELASLVSSGCSCLRLSPSTVEERSTELKVYDS